MPCWSNRVLIGLESSRYPISLWAALGVQGPDLQVADQAAASRIEIEILIEGVFERLTTPIPQLKCVRSHYLMAQTAQIRQTL